MKKLAIIFLENPPYFSIINDGRENKGTSLFNGKKDKKYVKTYVHTLMPKGGIDLDEQFVWSVFELYQAYAYIHYGPIKIWKTVHLLDKEVRSAYLCNKEYFNAYTAALALIYWRNKDVNNDIITFDSELGKYKIKKVHKGINKLITDTKENAICSVIIRNSMPLPRMNKLFDANTKFCCVNTENLLNILPLYVACRDEYSEYGKNPYNNSVDFRIIETIGKSSDGGTKYQKDTKFLQDCLLWTLCTHKQDVSSDIFYTTCESLLDDEHKSTEIYKLYKQLVDETGINGLKNIQHTLGRTNTNINKLKHLLSIFQYETIRPKMLEYELLK